MGRSKPPGSFTVSQFMDYLDTVKSEEEKERLHKELLKKIKDASKQKENRSSAKSIPKERRGGK